MEVVEPCCSAHCERDLGGLLGAEERSGGEDMLSWTLAEKALLPGWVMGCRQSHSGSIYSLDVLVASNNNAVLQLSDLMLFPGRGGGAVAAGMGLSTSSRDDVGKYLRNVICALESFGNMYGVRSRRRGIKHRRRQRLSATISRDLPSSISSLSPKADLRSPQEQRKKGKKHSQGHSQGQEKTI